LLENDFSIYTYSLVFIYSKLNFYSVPDKNQSCFTIVISLDKKLIIKKRYIILAR